MGSREPFASFPIIETSSADRAEQILSRNLYKLRLVRVKNPHDYNFLMNGLSTGGVFLGFNRFGAETEVELGQNDDGVGLALVSPNEGVKPTVFHVDGESVPCTQERAPIVSHGRKVFISRPKGSEILIVRASNAAIKRRFFEVTGKEMRRPPRFHRFIDLREKEGAALLGMVNFVVSELACSDTILRSPLLKAGINDLLLGAILALPGPHLEDLNRDPRDATPRIVRLAEEFLEAHASEPVTISDLAEVCKCSQRSLFLVFKNHRGYTPMQFLQYVRLESARARLLNSKPTENVTSIAQDCGFMQLSRFSAAYRRRFDESPSVTLKKARK